VVRKRGGIKQVPIVKEEGWGGNLVLVMIIIVIIRAISVRGFLMGRVVSMREENNCSM